MERLAETSEEVRATVAELSVYAGWEVVRRTRDILGNWKSVFSTLLTPEDLSRAQASVDRGPEPKEDQTESSSEVSDTSEPPQHAEAQTSWPPQLYLDTASSYAAAHEELDPALTGLRGQLVMRVRADLGVDALPPWRRLAWWRAARKADREFDQSEGAPELV